MKVTMNIGKNTADVDIQDMNEKEFLRLVFCAVRVVAITCLEAGAALEDIEPVIMAEVGAALEDAHRARRF